MVSRASLVWKPSTGMSAPARRPGRARGVSSARGGIVAPRIRPDRSQASIWWTHGPRGGQPFPWPAACHLAAAGRRNAAPMAVCRPGREEKTGPESPCFTLVDGECGEIALNIQANEASGDPEMTWYGSFIREGTAVSPRLLCRCSGKGLNVERLAFKENTVVHFGYGLYSIR